MSSASQASTGVRARRTPTTSDYSALLQRVRAAGLLERRTGFYLWLTGALLGALAAALVGVLAVRDPLWQLVLAVITGLILAQLGFVAHEAAHREVFASGRANDRFGRLLADLVVGISYSSWKSGHNRHHANPNQLGKDPSVDPGVFVFTEEQAATARGAYRWYLRRQGLLYYPVLLLAGLNLYIQSFATVVGRSPVERRWQELALLLLRTVALLAVLASAMPWGRVVAFLGVQVVAFGVATASSFIVNHVGMPVLPANAELDYLRRQVTTSRNIRGGWAATAWMGGLNFQIEHHLFPSMPRPNLRAASAVVKQYCAEKGIGYTEVSLPSAYAAVHRYMAYMGSRAGLPSSACPTAGMLGR